jgi:photosystem II stability/assembly factor-like uncharacterized protein
MKTFRVTQRILIIIITVMVIGGAVPFPMLAEEPENIDDIPIGPFEDFFIYLPLIFKAPILWHTQTSNISGKSINGVGCSPASSSDCVAGGEDVTLNTDDGGNTWNVISGLADVNILDVSCGSASLCIAAGANSDDTSGVYLYTIDGGQTWTRKNEPYIMYGTDCYDGNSCIAVGQESEVRYTTDGAGSWESRRLGNTDLHGVDCISGSSCWMVGQGGRVIGAEPVIPKIDIFATGIYAPPNDKRLYDISCQNYNTCVTVGQSGVIARSTNATGRVWNTSISSGVTQNLNGVSCPTATRCYAVGDSGTMLKSEDGGVNWVAETVPISVGNVDFEGIDCFSEQNCMAVGANGTILYRYSD